MEGTDLYGEPAPELSEPSWKKRERLKQIEAAKAAYHGEVRRLPDQLTPDRTIRVMSFTLRDFDADFDLMFTTDGVAIHQEARLARFRLSVNRQTLRKDIERQRTAAELEQSKLTVAYAVDSAEPQTGSKRS